MTPVKLNAASEFINIFNNVFLKHLRNRHKIEDNVFCLIEANYFVFKV